MTTQTQTPKNNKTCQECNQDFFCHLAKFLIESGGTPKRSGLCQECRDKQLAEIQTENRKASPLTEEQKRQNFTKLFPKNLIYPKYNPALLPKSDIAKQAEYIFNWQPCEFTPRKSIILFGQDSGEAKTFIAFQLAFILYKQGYKKIHYQNHSELTDLTLTQKRIVANNCKSAKLLILDDLGKCKATTTTYSILEHRFSRQKTTIITCNYSPDELNDICGNFTTRRISDFCDIFPR